MDVIIGAEDLSCQSVDLTEMARDGKLDPTIGRDEGMLYTHVLM